jgi:6-phosphogluconolactonase
VVPDLTADSKPDLRIYPDAAALSVAAAASLVETMQAAARRATRCMIALAGGTTPRLLYHELATTHRDRVPWSQVHLCWSDERYVPADDAQSNYRMVRETLIDHVPIPSENVHRMPTELPDPDAAARAYEVTLERILGPGLPSFDVILLGMGADGHTASLFPGSPALQETARRVVAVGPPAAPSVRLTLTYPVLNRAARVEFLIAGGEKAPAVRRVLEAECGPNECPATGVRPASGALIWWIDRAALRLAAGRLPRP